MSPAGAGHELERPVRLPSLVVLAVVLVVWEAVARRYGAYVMPSPASGGSGLVTVVLYGRGVDACRGVTLPHRDRFGGALVVAVLMGLALVPVAVRPDRGRGHRDRAELDLGVRLDRRLPDLVRADRPGGDLHDVHDHAALPGQRPRGRGDRRPPLLEMAKVYRLSGWDRSGRSSSRPPSPISLRA